MYKLYYKIRSIKKSGSGTVYVTMRLKVGEEITRTTGVSVLPQHFDIGKGKVSTKDVQAIEKNAQIQVLVSAMEQVGSVYAVLKGNQTKAEVEEELANQLEEKQVLKEFDEENEVWTANVFIPKLRDEIEVLRKQLATKEQHLAKLLGESTAVKRDLFTARIDEYIATAKNLKSDKTKGGYQYLKTLVKRFNKNLQITEVNLKTLNDFQSWLVKTPTRTGGKWRNGSIRLMITKFKSVYIYFADDLSLSTAFFKKFELVDELANENVVYLNKDELNELANVKLKADLQIRIRDQFLVLAETGLRQIDACFTRADVYEVQDKAGNKYKEIRLNQDKVNKLVSIPLTSRAEEILERNDYSFAHIDNRFFNQALKQIAKKCPMLRPDFTTTNFNASNSIKDVKPKWEFITTKVARKTFVDNCFELGVSESTVAAWLGHKNTLMVQKHYMHKAEQAKREAHKILA